MSAEKKALEHAIAWTIQNIHVVNKEAQDLLDNKEIDEKEKLKLLHGPAGTDYRLLNLLLLLKPMLEFAKESYPDYPQFFEWFDEKWNLILEQNVLKGPCNCKGCKKEEDNEGSKEA